ncbi:MAG: BON domain-containing protein [Rhodocyclaceae bacterium]|nr:BON domain-containing protein [Rhodocyclaceae bacterium]
MQSFKRISATLVALTCLTAVAYAAEKAAEPTPAKESAGDYVSDSWITTKVKTSLMEDKLVKATEVNVETYKGTVQLSGFVSSEAAMAQAIKVAQGVKGVTSVKNNMRVK